MYFEVDNGTAVLQSYRKAEYWPNKGSDVREITYRTGEP